MYGAQRDDVWRRRVREGNKQFCPSNFFLFFLLFSSPSFLFPSSFQQHNQSPVPSSASASTSAPACSKYLEQSTYSTLLYSTHNSNPPPQERGINLCGLRRHGGPHLRTIHVIFLFAPLRLHHSRASKGVLWRSAGSGGFSDTKNRHRER